MKSGMFSNFTDHYRENIREKQGIADFGTQAPLAITGANANNGPSFRNTFGPPFAGLFDLFS
jgi:hypothetical protein